MDDVPKNLDAVFGTATATSANWRTENIDFTAVNENMQVTDPVMLWLATAASFIESASDIYTENLVEYFSADAEISSWLASQWEPEELQHGKTLRTYVEAAWPEFDWEAALRVFWRITQSFVVLKYWGLPWRWSWLRAA